MLDGRVVEITCFLLYFLVLFFGLVWFFGFVLFWFWFFGFVLFWFCFVCFCMCVCVCVLRFFRKKRRGDLHLNACALLTQKTNVWFNYCNGGG